MRFVKQFGLIFALCLLSFNSFSQSLLVVEKISADVENLKYKTGDKIILKPTNKEKFHGYITKINDSIITVNNNPLLLKDIHTIYTERPLFLVLSSVGIMGGGAFIVVDSFNNLINKENPVFKKEALMAGGMMLATGYLAGKFIFKKHNISKDGWRLKVLNYYNLVK